MQVYPQANLKANIVPKANKCDNILFYGFQQNCHSVNIRQDSPESTCVRLQIKKVHPWGTPVSPLAVGGLKQINKSINK